MTPSHGWATPQAEIDLEVVARKLIAQAFPRIAEPGFCDGVRWETLLELRSAVNALDKRTRSPET